MFSDCVAISHCVIIFLVIEVQENELHIDINGKYDRGTVSCVLQKSGDCLNAWQTPYQNWGLWGVSERAN